MISLFTISASSPTPTCRTGARMLAVVVAVLLMSGSAHAFGFRYGIEWGYTGTFYETHHYNYLSDVGARVDVNSQGPVYYSNGDILGYAGLIMGRHIEADVVCGWAGVVQGRRVVPVMARGTYFFNGTCQDGLKVYVDGGLCLARTSGSQLCPIARAGCGYRLMLTERTALDFSAALQGISDHPDDVYVTEYHYSVPPESLRRSDRRYAGLTLSLALSF